MRFATRLCAAAGSAAVALLSVFALPAALADCGTILTVDPALPDGQSGEDATTGDADADADADAHQGCRRFPACTGTVVWEDAFGDIDAGTWTRVGNDVGLDDAVFRSPPSSLRGVADGDAGRQGGVKASRTVVGRPAHLCIGMSAQLEVGPDAFGTGEDRVELLSLKFHANDDGGLARAGGFNIGLARSDYLFTEGLSSGGDETFGVSNFDNDGGFPRSSWATVRIEIDYRDDVNAGTPSFVLFVDGMRAMAGPLLKLGPRVDSATLTLGALAEGIHPRVVARIDDLCVTSY